MKATVAIDASGERPSGIAVRYPSGTTLHCEYFDPTMLLDSVERLLTNGLPWRVLVATPADERVSGALWYLAAKHGAEFSERPLPDATDGQLRSMDLWRRAMPAANRAARLFLDEGND